MTVRLSIELIPSSMWYANLRSVLPRKDWDKIRRACYRKARYHCEICGGQGPKHPVECHERWDFDSTHQIQKLLGTIALCPACHEVKHFGLTGVRGKQDRAKRHLMHVNNWDLMTCVEHINAAFAEFEIRSQQEWQLDLNWLNTQGIAWPPLTP